VTGPSNNNSSDEEISAGISERKKIENTARFWDLCWADMQIALQSENNSLHHPETRFLLRDLAETDLFGRPI
jgi:hypothetical protein